MQCNGGNQFGLGVVVGERLSFVSCNFFMTLWKSEQEVFNSEQEALILLKVKR